MVPVFQLTPIQASPLTPPVLYRQAIGARAGSLVGMSPMAWAVACMPPMHGTVGATGEGEIVGCEDGLEVHPAPTTAAAATIQRRQKPRMETSGRSPWIDLSLNLMRRLQSGWLQRFAPQANGIPSVGRLNPDRPWPLRRSL